MFSKLRQGQSTFSYVIRAILEIGNWRMIDLTNSVEMMIKKTTKKNLAKANLNVIRYNDVI